MYKIRITKSIGVSAVIIGLPAIYFAGALFLDCILSFRDLSRYFYPIRFFTVSSIKSGVLPLWNPYIYCGMPNLAAQQSCVFYPPSIIYYMFPFDFAFNFFLIFHVFLAGLFTYLLCRHWNYKRSASLLAAIIFMLGGYMVSMVNLPTTLSSVVWFPLVLLFFDKALAAGGAQNMAITALSLAVMFLGGEPSIFYCTVLVLMFYAVFFAKNNDNRGAMLKTVSFRYIFVVLLGALIVAVNVFPFIEFIKYSDRAGKGFASYEIYSTWSLPVKDILDLFVTKKVFYARELTKYLAEQNWAFSLYSGALAFLLIFVCVILSREWRIRFLYFIGIVFLLLSYGKFTPFHKFLYEFMPGISLVRYPVRYVYVVIFTVAMLSGAGLDNYIRNLHAKGARIVRLSKMLLPMIFFAAILMVLTPLSNAIRFLGIFVFGGLILIFGINRKIRGGFVAMSFVLITIGDLFLTDLNPSMYMIPSEKFHSSTKNIDLIKRDAGLSRFLISPKVAKKNSFLEGPSYADAVQIAKDRLCSNWPILYGLYDANGYESVMIASCAKLITLIMTSPGPDSTNIMDMMNVKYMLFLDKIKSERYKPILEQGDTSCLYENTRVLPRAFLVGSHIVLNREEDIADKLKSTDFDPSRELVLEEEPVLKYQSIEVSKYQGVEKAEIIKYAPNEVMIEAAVKESKFLFMSDTYYPGWKVYVDGKRDKIYKANFTFRAVYLGPGIHAVRFVYDPFTFKLGAVVSLATFAGIIVYVIYDLVTRKRRKRNRRLE